MKISPHALVSIVIVNYNGEHLLEECLNSVYAQTYDTIEVIVVDNASTDESVAIIKKKFPDVQLIVSEQNMGFAGGNNRGVVQAKGEYVVLLNNDAVVESNWLPPLIEQLERTGVGAVASKVITEDVPSAFYEMNGTINYLGYNIMREFADLSRVFFAGGASLMFRREAIGQPFLDDYFLYHEDVFLSWKLRLKGMAAAMAQSSVVHHKGSATSRRQSSSRLTFFQERNRLLNALLLYEARTLVLLIPYFIADAIVKLLLSITGRKSFVGIIQSYWWIVMHPDWITRERRTLQSQRIVSDREVMSVMSHKVIDGQSIVSRSVNGISRKYARLVGLAFHE